MRIVFAMIYMLFFATLVIGLTALTPQAQAQNICGNATPDLLQRLAHLQRPVTVRGLNTVSFSEASSCDFETHELNSHWKETPGTIIVAMVSDYFKDTKLVDGILPRGYAWACNPELGLTPAKALWCFHETKDGVFVFLENRGSISSVYLSLPGKSPAQMEAAAVAIAKETVLKIAPAKPLIVPAIWGNSLTAQDIKPGLWDLRIYSNNHLINNGEQREDAHVKSCSIADGGMLLTGAFFPGLASCGSLRVFQLSPTWERVYALCSRRVGEQRSVDVEVNIIVDSPNHFLYEKQEDSGESSIYNGIEHIDGTYKGKDCDKYPPGLILPTTD